MFMDRMPDSTWSDPQTLLVAGTVVSSDGQYVVSRGKLLNLRGDVVREEVYPPGITRMREYTWLNSRLYYLGADPADNVTGIWSLSPSGGPIHQHVRFDDPTRVWHRYGFQPFADRLYFTLGEREGDVWAADLGLSNQ